MLENVILSFEGKNEQNDQMDTGQIDVYQKEFILFIKRNSFTHASTYMHYSISTSAPMHKWTHTCIKSKNFGQNICKHELIRIRLMHLNYGPRSR